MLLPFPVDLQRQAVVFNALAAELPPHCLIADAEQTRAYECDGLSGYRQLPMLVALPDTEQQLVAVLRICHDLEVPVVTRGAGTGLAGGAMPHPAGVLLSTARLNRITRIDPLARVAVVQSGVRNLAISQAAAPFNLFYAPDPSSQIACTIGGNVAANSGGVHCLKYGLTVHNVLGARVACANGDVIELGGEALDAPGLDLLPLIVGSEGTLGVVLEVTVRLLPKPASAQVIMASFPDLRSRGRGGVGDHRRRPDSGRAGDDGPGLNPHGRTVRAGRLRRQRGRHSAVRSRWHRVRSDRGNRAHDSGAARGRRQCAGGVGQRRGTAALLVGPQERFPGRRPHLA